METTAALSTQFWMTLGDWQKYFIGLDGPPGQEGYMQVLETGASEKGTLRSILGQGSLSTIKKNR